ncbi:MAG: hypothetical protein GXO47_10920 [Chlorobi bacterium]|nr:hypothetical protein [Chlorobiota bacterium]
MENFNENTNTTKQRHGCVTAWLILMIIVNSAIALLYLFAGDKVAQNFPGGIPKSILILLAVTGILNVVFAILLFKWKKIGFWGFLITGTITAIINFSLGLGVFQSLFGLTGIVILYGILQIKKDNVPAWENLE